MPQPTTESEKWARVIAKFDGDMIKTLDSLGRQELKERVLQSQYALIENTRKKALDRDLAAASLEKAEYETPYKEVKSFQEAILQYSMLLLENAGG